MAVVVVQFMPHRMHHHVGLALEWLWLWCGSGGGLGGAGGGHGWWCQRRHHTRLRRKVKGPLPGYTLIAIARRPPLTGTGDTIGGTHTMTPVTLSLGHTPPATDDAGLQPKPSTFTSPGHHLHLAAQTHGHGLQPIAMRKSTITATPFSTQEPPQRHAHMACDPYHYDADDHSNQVDDDGGDEEGDVWWR
ncbi:hypothetical protein EDB83DRAFT_2324852 [Lactarius deliciosus]|nr:hypothetical protein EDB83DRAFT_2324852 [Lactarius deliciosus]